MNDEDQVKALLDSIDRLIESHENVVPYMIIAANLSKITYESGK